MALSGYQSDLPQALLQSKLSVQLKVQAVDAPTVLPKGSKLLQVMLFVAAFMSEKGNFCFGAADL